MGKWDFCTKSRGSGSMALHWARRLLVDRTWRLQQRVMNAITRQLVKVSTHTCSLQQTEMSSELNEYSQNKCQ